MFSAPENVNLSIVHSEEMLHSKFQALFVYHIYIFFFKKADTRAKPMTEVSLVNFPSVSQLVNLLEMQQTIW